MSRLQPMKVYQDRPYGVVLHITEQYDFWKHFQVIGSGSKRGHIVGGPGDGGSHTPEGHHWRVGVQTAQAPYSWFKEEKNSILAQYNTVYHNSDYNEFIVNGLSKS